MQTEAAASAAVAAVEEATVEAAAAAARAPSLRATLIELNGGSLSYVHVCSDCPLTPEEVVYHGGAPPPTAAAAVTDADMCVRAARPPGRGSVCTKAVWEAYTNVTSTTIAGPGWPRSVCQRAGRYWRGGGSDGDNSVPGILGPFLYTASGEALAVTVLADTPFPRHF